MKGFARPSPDQERWLAAGAALGTVVPDAAIAERAGRWRSTGILARIALFVLGLVAVALTFGIFGFGDSITLLAAGIAAAITAESLAAGKRLFASGIEEGLCLGGWLLLGGWLATMIGKLPGFGVESVAEPVLIAAAAAAGLRLLNPLVTTCAVIAFVRWVGSFRVAAVVDETLGAGAFMLIFGCSLALLALELGARQYRRPSHDRMLDWLVAALPLASYASASSWRIPDATYAIGTGSGALVRAALLVAVGAAMLSTGLRRRRHAPLLGFMGCVVCLAIELRAGTGLATEGWLIGCGLVALAIGLALDRYLREPRNGFTSAALSSRECPLDLLQTVGASALTQSHAASAAAPAPESEVTGGGGRFGGGGASGSF